MRFVIPSLFAVLILAAPALAQPGGDESLKASSGERFVEKSGDGSASGGAAVYAGNGSGDRSAEALVNSSEHPAGLKTGSPPPLKGDRLKQAGGTATGALVGGVLGFGGGTPFGVPWLGAMAGAAVGALVGGWLAKKSSEGTTGSLENAINERNRQMEDLMKQ